MICSIIATEVLTLIGSEAAVRGIAEQGVIDCPANPFLYTKDILDFFEEWEDSIEDELQRAKITYGDLLVNCYSVKQLQEEAVRWVVDRTCEEWVHNARRPNGSNYADVELSE